MLALREELRAESGGNPRSSIEYGTIFLANMDDPGLLVFPTHRVVHGLPSFDRAAVLEQARAFFTVEEAAIGRCRARCGPCSRRRAALAPTFGDGERRSRSPI